MLSMLHGPKRLCKVTPCSWGKDWVRPCRASPCPCRFPRHASRASSGHETSTSSFESPRTGSHPPWAFGFQMNERYLDWDSAAHTQLLKIACAEKLGVEVADIEVRLRELAALIPDLAQKLGKMKADVLVRLLADTEKLAARLAVLRGLLPSTNLSQLVSRLPSIVLDYEAEDLAARLQILRDTFGSRTDVEFLVAREPSLLRCAGSAQQMAEVVRSVERLLPVKDSIGFIISNPGLVLDMDSSNLPSAIDGDLTQED